VKFLVTGGCGFIGTNLVHALVRAGHQVKVMDWEPKNKSIVGCSTTDMRDPLVPVLTSGVDVVVHLAAQSGVAPSIEDPKLSHEHNVYGTLNMLDACIETGVKRFIFASSGTVLGQASPPFKEDSYGRPTSPYGADKLAGEAYCSAFYHSYGLETVVLRFSNIYGPYAWHKNNLFVEFIKAALKEKPLHIYGDGRQTRDFLYVKDLVEAIILASTVPDIGGQVFQIASGKETSVLTLLEIMKAISLDEIAQEVEYTFEPPRPGEAKRSYAYNSYAKLMLGWEPKYDLVAGMTETFRWYLRKYYYE
jgi:UDP-glucose 4-epimerase